eukprot:6301284-Amphidinium_carterae.2
MAKKSLPKPPPGFPPGTSVPLGFTVLSGGRMLYQPALLPQDKIVPQTKAIDLGIQAVPGSTQVTIVNGQVMIATGTADNAVNMDFRAAADNRYSQPSEVVMRLKCSFCNTADAIDASADQERLTTLSPPSPSGVKDFPDCLWCKDHEKIVLPQDPFMRKIGPRDDWYYWDPVEQYQRAWKSEITSDVAPKWRMRGESQGVRNYRDSVFKRSVMVYKEESLIWARGPGRGHKHIRVKWQTSGTIKLIVEKKRYGGYIKPEEEKQGDDVGVDYTTTFPPQTVVYLMVDDDEERECASRTPSDPATHRNSSHHQPSFQVMLAKMDRRKRKKELSARTRHQHKTLEEALEEAPWRRLDDMNQPVEISDADTDDTMPLSALKSADAKQTENKNATRSGSSSVKEQSSKRKKKNPEKTSHFLEIEYHGSWWTGILHDEFRTKTYDINQHHFINDLDSETEVFVDAMT